MPEYKITLTYEGQTVEFIKTISHDGSITDSEVVSTIINDFLSNYSMEVESVEPHATPKADNGNNSSEYMAHYHGLDRVEHTSCPKCGSDTFTGCPACEDYL
jgi:hypothetical protein